MQLGRLRSKNVLKGEVEGEQYECDLHRIRVPTGHRGYRLYCHKARKKKTKKKAKNMLVAVDLTDFPKTTRNYPWGKLVTGVDLSKRTGYAFKGKFVRGESIDKLPVGGIVLWRYTQQDVSIYIVKRIDKLHGKLEKIFSFENLPKQGWAIPVAIWLEENVFAKN